MMELLDETLHYNTILLESRISSLLYKILFTCSKSVNHHLLVIALLKNMIFLHY